MANPHPSNPIKKGETRNPGGRPKMPWTFMGLYRKELEKLLTIKGSNKKVKAKHAMAARIVRMAIEGDINAIKEIANRIEGFPKQPTDLTSQGQKIEGLVTYMPKRKNE